MSAFFLLNFMIDIYHEFNMFFIVYINRSIYIRDMIVNNKKRERERYD